MNDIMTKWFAWYPVRLSYYKFPYVEASNVWVWWRWVIKRKGLYLAQVHYHLEGEDWAKHPVNWKKLDLIQEEVIRNTKPREFMEDE